MSRFYNKSESQKQKNIAQSDGISSNISKHAANTVIWDGSICGCGNNKKCTRCVNLVQDPSFEWQAFEWITSNTDFADSSAFEGAIQAALGPGVAVLEQEISLRGVRECPLLFSFNAFADINPATNENPGILIVQISWLDENFNFIGLGLRMLVPADRLNNNARITFIAQTDVIPKNAAFAKLAFTKGEGLSEENDCIYIDNVILAPMAFQNLIKNGGFEANLFGWTADSDNGPAFHSSYSESLVDSGHVITTNSGALYQDVNIRQLSHKYPFLLGFAVQGDGRVELSVHVEWLNQNGITIGTGLFASIPNETLDNQENYLSYLFVTSPPICGATTARIIFEADVPNTGDFLRLDQVLFIPVLSCNLVSNPSFENNLNNWCHDLATRVQRNDVYEGSYAARLDLTGGALWQDVDLYCPEGQSFLLSIGIGFRQTSVESIYGTTIIKVIWLDKHGRELGEGLNLISSRNLVSDIVNSMSWVHYIGITDPAPEGAAKARILITRTDGNQGFVEIDNVVFARIV